MRKVSLLVGVGLAAVAGALWIGQALSQEGEGGRRRGGEGRRQFDPQRMRQMMFDRIKERLQVGDEEWQVVQPKLQKVMDLSAQAGPGRGGMRFMFGGRRGGPGAAAGGGPGGERRRPEGAPERELSEVQKATQALAQTLEKTDAPADDIKAKLTALRAAREKAKQDLAKARAELRELLTQRQEALMVLMGQLD